MNHVTIGASVQFVRLDNGRILNVDMIVRLDPIEHRGNWGGASLGEVWLNGLSKPMLLSETQYNQVVEAIEKRGLL